MNEPLFWNHSVPLWFNFAIAVESYQLHTVTSHYLNQFNLMPNTDPVALKDSTTFTSVTIQWGNSQYLFLSKNLHLSLENHAKDLFCNSISETASDLNKEPTTTALL